MSFMALGPYPEPEQQHGTRKARENFVLVCIIYEHRQNCQQQRQKPCDQVDEERLWVPRWNIDILKISIPHWATTIRRSVITRARIRLFLATLLLDRRYFIKYGDFCAMVMASKQPFITLQLRLVSVGRQFGKAGGLMNLLTVCGRQRAQNFETVVSCWSG